MNLNDTLAKVYQTQGLVDALSDQLDDVMDNLSKSVPAEAVAYELDRNQNSIQALAFTIKFYLKKITNESEQYEENTNSNGHSDKMKRDVDNE